MIHIKTQEQIAYMRIACQVVKEALDLASTMAKPGITTKAIDTAVEKLIRSRGCVPSFKGYGGFPCASCTSVNDIIVHGIPGNRILKEGDILSVDIGACYHDYHGDAARTFAIGQVSPKAQKLMRVCEESFWLSIKNLKAGEKLNLIGTAIQQHAEANGFAVIRELCGHGIGKNLHEEPEVLNITSIGGGRLYENQTIAIEPMIAEGSRAVVFETPTSTSVVRTQDGKYAAHYENTILITKTGVEVLTQ